MCRKGEIQYVQRYQVSGTCRECTGWLKIRYLVGVGDVPYVHSSTRIDAKEFSGVENDGDPLNPLSVQ